jgi:hypothetical protein
VSADSITFASAARHNSRLAKIVYLQDRRIIDVEPAPKALLHNFRQIRITSLAELMAAIQDAACKGEIAVRGEPLAAVGRRAIYDDPEAGLAGLREVPRAWCGLDWDRLRVDGPQLEPPPPWIADDPAEASSWATPDPLLDPELGARAALLLLPPAFRSASCGWQVSASAGFRGWRLRTWHKLDAPTTGAELQFWLAPPIVDTILDPVTLRPAQPLYLAISFIGGPDPCPRRFGILQSACDLVAVPDIAGMIRRQQEAVRQARRQVDRRRPQPPDGDFATAFLQRCVDTVGAAVDGTKHIVYLHEAARAKAFCDKHDLDWPRCKRRLMDIYEMSLPAGEADRRRRGSILGVMKWVESR